MPSSWLPGAVFSRLNKPLLNRRRVTNAPDLALLAQDTVFFSEGGQLLALDLRQPGAALKATGVSDASVKRPLVLPEARFYASCRSRREDMPSPSRLDLPQGTLDLLILQTLVLEPQHGWAISGRVQQMSRDVLQVQQGSLYPALHRLERRGWIKARWRVTQNNRRARYYELTAAGRHQLDAQKHAWVRLTGTMARVLGID